MRHEQASNNEVKWNALLGSAKTLANLVLSAKDQDVTTRRYYPKRSDDQIAQDVRGEFRLEKTIDADSVTVLVKNGDVTLTGSVDGGGQKWLIDAAVKRIAGVKTVTDKMEIIVQEPGIRTDEDIRRECEHALGMTVQGANHAIKVMVSSGWVTLSGNVDWGYERWSAEEIVSHLPGVSGVNGQIKVRSMGLQEDVKANIKTAISSDSACQSPEIDIVVSRNQVILDGAIYTLAQRRAATNAAWSTRGVKNVTDHTVLV